jgi:hypothetical protein
MYDSKKFLYKLSKKFLVTDTLLILNYKIQDFNVYFIF